MKLNVLISCMNETDTSIVARSNIQSDAVVVNQCDTDSVIEYDFTNKNGKVCHVKFINTSERGLSRSRNMAIANAWGDICLLCDDDEQFEDNYCEIIENAYVNYPDTALATFNFNYQGKLRTSTNETKRMSIIDILKTSSIQISFRRDVLIRNSIKFDEKMGSGTGNGSGEEIKFQNDFRKKGLLCLSHPYSIVTLQENNNSSWFKGYTFAYFENFGWSTRRTLGNFWGFSYLVYFAFSHRRLYQKELSVIAVVKAMFKGYRSKR